MSKSIDLKLKDVLESVKDKNLDFLQNDIINIIKTKNDEEILENILIVLSNLFFDKINIFIEKGILQFKQDYDYNIKTILQKLLDNDKHESFSCLYNTNKFKKYFSIFKENAYYLEKLLYSAIITKNNELFFDFYNKNTNSIIEYQDLISSAAYSNSQQIYTALVDNENFFSIQYFISNLLFNKNINVFFIKDYFKRLKNNNIEWTKVELYNYLGKSIKNTESFIFIFNLLDDINNFRICELMEKAIKAHNYDIICFLNSKITFKIIDYDYDFITTFLESYKNEPRNKIFFSIEEYFIEREDKINILRCLINNPNIFNVEKEVDKLVYLSLQKFDLDIIKYLIKNFNLKYQTKDEISNIRLHESFFKGLNSENVFVNYENMLFILKYFKINLYYRDNIYLYQSINKFCSKDKLSNNFINKNLITVEEYKKIINYFLNNENVFENFNFKYIKIENNFEVLDFINNKIKFHNF